METEHEASVGSGESEVHQDHSTHTGLEQNTLMAALSYIGPLVIVSYIFGKDDAFVKFHISQGLVIFVIEVASWFVGVTLFMLMPLVYLLHVLMVILSVVGIINAVQHKEKQLPFIGSWGRYFKL